MCQFAVTRRPGLVAAAVLPPNQCEESREETTDVTVVRLVREQFASAALPSTWEGVCACRCRMTLVAWKN